MKSPYLAGFILWVCLCAVALAAWIFSFGIALGPLVIGLAVLNLGTFLLYGADKFFALAKWRRVPEKILYLAAFLGGSAGALLGMFVFRHKVSKTSFQLVFVFLVLLQVAIVYSLLKEIPPACPNGLC